MKFKILSIITCGLLVVACSKTETKPNGNNRTDTESPEKPSGDKNIPNTTYGIIQLDLLQDFTDIPKETILTDQREREISGIAASQKYNDILYTHGDNKNSPIYITNKKGEALGQIIIEGYSTIDPEDISVGPGPEKNKSYIYFADIGDNDHKRNSINIYRFEEPTFDISKAGAQTKLFAKNISKLEMKYPDEKFNAESILIDPITKDIFILTKETYKAKVFKAAYPQQEKTELKQVLNMKSFDLFTGSDISSDGTEILIRNKSQIWYWKRNINQSIIEALQKAPLKAPYMGNERQGEAICFTKEAKGYFTISEVKDWPELESTLTFYKRN